MSRLITQQGQHLDNTAMDATEQALLNALGRYNKNYTHIIHVNLHENF